MKVGDHAEAARLTAELGAADVRPVYAPPKKSLPAVLIVVAGTCAVAFVLAGAFGAGALLGRAAPPAREIVPVEAITNCQAALRSRLNYPATADFGWFGTQSRIDGGQYYVWQDFRAKNGFGVESEVRGLCIFPPGRATQNPEVIM